MVEKQCRTEKTKKRGLTKNDKTRLNKKGNIREQKV